MRFPALQPSDRPTPTRTGRGVIPFVAMTLFYGGLQIGYAKVQPDHPVKRSTRLKNRLNITVVDPFVGNCKFAMQAETIKPFLKPSYTWNRLVGTGQFEGSPDLVTGNIPLVNSVAGEFARFVPKDFAENRVEVHDTVNNVERTDTPKFSDAISLTLNECHVAINNPDEETLLVNVASLPLQPVKRCPIVSSGQTFKWFIQNSAGPTATIKQDNLVFAEEVPEIYSVSVDYTVLSKTCISPLKEINVGQIVNSNVDWRDSSNLFNDPKPDSTFRKKATLTFTIPFLPDLAIVKDAQRVAAIKGDIDLAVSVRDNPAGFSFKKTPGAGSANEKVLKVEVDNQTNNFVTIDIFITLAGSQAHPTITILVAAL